jgi:elongation factor 1-beta
VFSKLPNNVNAAVYPNVFRWYNHIASFSVAQRTAFAGSVSCSSSSAKAASVADDDDMFGDVDEDTEEERREIECQKAQAAIASKRAAAGKVKEVAKSTVVLGVSPLEAETGI